MEEGWKNFRNAFKQSWNKVFRYGCYFILFEFVTLALGFAIFMICHGLWILVSRLVIYWKPARALSMRLVKIQDEKYLQLPPFTWCRLISATVYLVGAVLMIYLGTRILVQDGFLKQNLIYLVLSR